MKILLAPAKNMYEIPETEPTGTPVFADEAALILETLKSKDEAELKKIWACNDALVKQNLARLESLDVSHGHLAAVEAYDRSSEPASLRFQS